MKLIIFQKPVYYLDYEKIIEIIMFFLKTPLKIQTILFVVLMIEIIMVFLKNPLKTHEILSELPMIAFVFYLLSIYRNFKKKNINMEQICDFIMTPKNIMNIVIYTIVNSVLYRLFPQIFTFLFVSYVYYSFLDYIYVD